MDLGHTQRPIPDDPRAQKRRGVRVRVAEWEAIHKVRGSHEGLGVPPGRVIPGEAPVEAQVLPSLAAPITYSVRRVEPRSSDPIPLVQPLDAGADGVYDANHLVPGNKRECGGAQVSFHDVEVGVADPAGVHTDAHLTGVRYGERHICQLKRSRADSKGRLRLQDQRLHRKNCASRETIRSRTAKCLPRELV
jgi:hypothetical protein